MKISCSALFAVLGTGLLLTPLYAADPQPNEAQMMAQMAELAKPNENHQLLAQLAGDWTDTITMWMAPGQPPLISKGTCTRKAVLGGRYFAADFHSTMQMPGPDGKIQATPFTGTSLEGYDNVKKKFVTTWADTMGTGILVSEGTYDPATKSFTYSAEMEMIPGVKSKMREVLKVMDKDHHTFEFYEDRGGQDVKTMEIAYTRAK